MSKVLQGLDFVFVYIDNLLIASSSPEEHHFSATGRTRHRDQCFQEPLGCSKTGFLGTPCRRHRHSPTGGESGEFPLPDTQRKLRRFLGLVNFYNRFIPGGAAILQPLHSLLKRTKCPSDLPPWTDDTTKVFDEVKPHYSSILSLTPPPVS